MEQVFLPDVDGLLELLQGLVAVGQAEEGVIVALVVFETGEVILRGLVEVSLLALDVAQSHQGVIVGRFVFQNFVEVVFRFVEQILFQVGITLF